MTKRTKLASLPPIAPSSPCITSDNTLSPLLLTEEEKGVMLHDACSRVIDSILCMHQNFFLAPKSELPLPVSAAHIWQELKSCTDRASILWDLEEVIPKLVELRAAVPNQIEYELDILKEEVATRVRQQPTC